MLKTRLIPVLNIMNGLIVRSEDFITHQSMGNVVNQASRYNEWNVDELIYLDISREFSYDLGRDDHKISRYSNIEEIIQRIAKVCFMPLAFGGGIKKIEDVDLRIKNGADKVIINTKALEDSSFITTISNKYGSQAAIVSVDYRIIDGQAMVFDNFGSIPTNKKLVDWCREIESYGAGEVFINSIDRDGKANGYDIENIAEVVDALKIPVIACGGAGIVDDFLELAEDTNVSAIAAGNIFHFTENAYPRAKKFLKREGINVR
ncbi:imidazole glycerol phosphate synthase subunit HisF [Halobacteriovorax marinus]|nr:imidazole glycerol phosphate synthase cyclase subunit [Halobacteriovorax marinus]